MLANAVGSVPGKFEEGASCADRYSGHAFSPGAGRGKPPRRLQSGAGGGQWPLPAHCASASS